MLLYLVIYDRYKVGVNGKVVIGTSKIAISGVNKANHRALEDIIDFMIGCC